MSTEDLNTTIEEVADKAKDLTANGNALEATLAARSSSVQSLNLSRAPTSSASCPSPPGVR